MNDAEWDRSPIKGDVDNIYTSRLGGVAHLTVL